MLHDVLHGIHNLSHAGFVVSAQEGRAVGRDDGLPLVGEQLGKIGRVQFQARDALQSYGRAVIVLDYLRLDILAGSVGSRVHVGDEAYLRHGPVDIRGDCGHHIAIFIEDGFDAHREKLVAEHLQEHEFLHFRRLSGRVLIGLGIHCDIAQKSV